MRSKLRSLSLPPDDTPDSFEGDVLLRGICMTAALCASQHAEVKQPSKSPVSRSAPVHWPSAGRKTSQACAPLEPEPDPAALAAFCAAIPFASAGKIT